jgi:predicted pyridoxine 5'-phosphate oxidase superfamily flavin-nucleotide-binding protein
MAAGYHEGEQEAQRRAGVAEAAARLQGLARAEMPPAAREFLPPQRLAIAASADGQGCLWASPLVGPAGFLSAPDPRTLSIRARLAPGDPLAANIDGETAIGLLVIDPAARRRMRVNGRARWLADGALEVVTDEVYANCPKYIRRRKPESTAVGGGPAVRADRLSGRARALIAVADTLFIATRHPDRGADASHRGGEPGFVQLTEEAGADLLSIPDYAGNNMFNTLGNLLVEPRAGLLFLDFEQGDAVQLTGRAEPRWNGAERELLFRVDQAVELPGALGHRWRAL